MISIWGRGGFSMSENPLVASDFLLEGHVTGYGRNFNLITDPATSVGFSLSNQNHVLLILRFSSVRVLFVMLDLMSDDHVTGYAAIFWRENLKIQ